MLFCNKGHCLRKCHKESSKNLVFAAGAPLQVTLGLLQDLSVLVADRSDQILRSQDLLVVFSVVLLLSICIAADLVIEGAGFGAVFA